MKYVFAFSGILSLFLIIYLAIYTLRKRGRFSPFTEKSLRPPGYSLSIQQDDLMGDLFGHLLCLTLMPPLCFLLMDFQSTLTEIILAITVLGLIAYFGVKTYRILLKAKQVGLGYDGEKYTGSELNYLMRQGAWVYHDLPYKYGNIDHLIVSTGGVFVVETKAYSKPQIDKGKRRESKATYKNGTLHFPDFATSKPLSQAKTHAKSVEKYLFKKVGKKFPVFPVVALPGWYVTGQGEVLVINPKRGSFLVDRVSGYLISEQEAAQIAEIIEDVARSVGYSGDNIDPDAGDNFDVFLNKKEQPRKID